MGSEASLDSCRMKISRLELYRIASFGLAERFEWSLNEKELVDMALAVGVQRWET